MARLFEILNQFLLFLSVRGFSQDTVRIRKVNLRKFVRWCVRARVRNAPEITKDILERYQQYLFFYRKKDGRPLAVSSQYSQLTVIKVWFKWMERRHIIRKDPTLELELPRPTYKLPSVFTKEQVERVLRQPENKKFTGIRDRAILEMLYSTGMRRMELLRLRIPDIDRSSGVLTIREGKGGKDRVVPVGERALYWLDKYLAEARPHFMAKSACDVIFLTSTGKPFTPNHLSWLAGRYVQAANLGKTGACHIFRHTMATLMLEGGADTRYIQAMLGHARLDTTQIYTHVSIRMLKRVHTDSHPSAEFEAEAEEPLNEHNDQRNQCT